MAEGKDMRLLGIWAVEFFRLLGGRRLHPVTTECPVCGQMVRLHVNKAGRHHVFAHARALYEEAALSPHRVAGAAKCAGSGSRKVFDPHPNERQRFRLPGDLICDRPDAG